MNYVFLLVCQLVDYGLNWMTKCIQWTLPKGLQLISFGEFFGVDLKKKC